MPTCALVHRPEILFLDEPTTGVDAVSRREFWDQLDVLRSSGLTIVVSTPYMSLRAQDRVIRLEERMRLMQLMPGEQSLIDGLRTNQLVALRFAPDAEAPALARRAAAGELQKGDAIKKEIQNWRPDFLRV